jgi:hypothetical protein
MGDLKAVFFLLCIVSLLFLPVRPALPADRAVAAIDRTLSTQMSASEEAETIQVVPDIRKRLAGLTEYNIRTCRAIDAGTWNITTQPAHGRLSFAIEKRSMSGGPCSGVVLPFNVAYYTWTDGTTADDRDSFSLAWSTGSGFTSETGNRTAEVEHVEIIPRKISFNWPGSPAITMYNACNGKPIAVPEYDTVAGTSSPAAFVRGSGPLKMKVKWRTTRNGLSKATVWASGGFGGIAPVEVSFVNGESDWVSMETKQPLPGEIKASEASFNWKYRTASSRAMNSIKTTHSIYTTNKAPSSAPVYLDLVKWTTDWCQSLRNPNDKTIADAILRGFASSGVIRYGIPGMYTTADILCNGGGMCGGMTEVFYDACGAQGVHVARSCYLLQDADPGSEEKWHSIIIYSPGVGQDKPTFEKQAVHAVDKVYPCPSYYGDLSYDDVIYQNRRVYEFFAPYDGHCINFLTYKNHVYLYDLSFGTGPFNDTFTAVPSGLTVGKDLTKFRKVYLNNAIDYMRGLISFEGIDTPCAVSPDGPRLDVKTPLIPYGSSSMSFLWYTNP